MRVRPVPREGARRGIAARHGAAALRGQTLAHECQRCPGLCLLLAALWGAETDVHARRVSFGDDLLDSGVATTGPIAFRRSDWTYLVPAALLGPRRQSGHDDTALGVATRLKSGDDLVELRNGATALERAKAISEVLALNDADPVKRLAAACHVSPPDDDRLHPHFLTAPLRDLAAQRRAFRASLAEHRLDVAVQVLVVLVPPHEAPFGRLLQPIARPLGVQAERSTRAKHDVVEVRRAVDQVV